MTEQTQETLISTVELGEEARNFLESRLATEMLAAMEDEADQALQDLKGVNPVDSEAIRRLQNIVWRCESFKGWLLETVVKGDNALEVFRHESQEQG